MDILVTEQKERVGVITLNRPNVFNSMNRELAISVQKALKAYAEDKNIRAIVLTGNGKAFCAGQDLQEITATTTFDINQVIDEYYNPLIKQIRTIEKPIISAVNGVAAGAGANIALACDVCVATESASFIQAFSKIGLVPDSGGTFILPRLIGFGKASALMMLGDKVSATEAEKMGLIYSVFPDDIFQEEVDKIAKKLANMPTKGLAYTKHLLNQSLNTNLSQQLELEKEYQHKATQTFDFKEGIDAFITKRKPKFKGE